MTPEEPRVIEIGKSEWRKTSQIAANLYRDGVPLWTKRDLEDIENQLMQSEKHEYFTVRLIDGTKGLIKNDMFGERLPIWQPRVDYHEYWRLVFAPPEGPRHGCCSYLVAWENTCAKRFRGVIENADSVFEENRVAWNKSASCRLLIEKLEHVLAARKVTNIICFGLGDMCRKSSELQKTQAIPEAQLEADHARPSMIQHAIALTIAGIYHDSTVDEPKLLAQDPDYTEEAKQLLERQGFSIVGQFGAGGFAEVDDNSIVFSAFVRAPLKQIIADIARPLVIISTGFAVFNDSGKPFADPESPRTKAMWEAYDKFDFPILPEDEQPLRELRGICVYVRKIAD